VTDVIARYKALRGQVLVSCPGREHGWAVFIRRGLLAWSEALTEELRRGPSVHTRTTEAVPTHLNRLVIQVLTSMVVQLQAEVSHGV
jgi:hypothetical protein